MWYEWSGGRVMRVLWPASGLLWPAVACRGLLACQSISLPVSLSVSLSLSPLSSSVLALPSSGVVLDADGK